MTRQGKKDVTTGTGKSSREEGSELGGCAEVVRDRKGWRTPGDIATSRVNRCQNYCSKIVSQNITTWTDRRNNFLKLSNKRFNKHRSKTVLEGDRQ